MNAARLVDPLTPSLREFVLDLGDAVLVLEPGGRVVLANPAARQLLGAAVPPLPASLAHVLGQQAAQRLQALLLDADGGDAVVPVAMGHGRSLQARAHRLDGAFWALRLRAPSRTLDPSAHALPSALDSAAARELIGMFWDSPFPATLQDESYRLVAVNDAFVMFSGRPRESLIGLDPVQLMPEEDRAYLLEQRALHADESGEAYGLVELRLIDAAGRERWYRAARRALGEGGAGDSRLFLAVLQDCSAEHAAREQADRSERDLEQWFEMSPLGMVLFDGSGLLVRTNPAFETLVGVQPIALPEAPPALQQLMGWDADGPSPLLLPGAPPLRREGWIGRPGAAPRRLRATLRAYETPGGHRRYMAAVQDLSAEEERDLARMQIGALMDTAGVGLATLLDAAWTAPAAPPTLPRDAAGAARELPVNAALESISRELVLPESLPEYERLQRALRRGERIETRYAIRHPELGLRWLLTRVEPGQLASGKRTTSVVTVDITDQEQARSRNEQLLRELGSILESSPAGIVHLRGDRLLRCNSAFERMVGVPPGSSAGRRWHEVFGALPAPQRALGDFVETIGAGTACEAEFELARPGGGVLWVSLSAHGHVSSSPGVRDVIAVMSDISRLKGQQADLELLARDRELMFNLSEVGIAFVREGRIQRANEAMRQLTGYDAGALASLEINALFADRSDFLRQWAGEDAALRQFGRWSGERMLRRADGSRIWVQVSKRLAVPGDPGGGLIASYVNVDDRHRAEASLAMQAETTRAILDSVLVGIVTVGADGISWMNRSARRMFGGELDDFVGLSIETVAAPDTEHPFRRRHYLTDLADGQAETFECEILARDGRAFWVAGNVVATTHLNAGRQLTYALLDIDRRREAEQRTAQAQVSLQRIIDMAPLAICLLDARQPALLQMNHAALGWIAQPVDAVVGQPPESVFTAGHARQLVEGVQAAVAACELVDREVRIERDGVAGVWDTRFLPLRGDDGRPEQVLVVATDVTEQRAAQQARLEAAIAQRDLLVKEVHHRIKNNLQGVAGLMQQIAQRRPEVADVIAEAVGQVQAIAQVYGLQVGATGPLRVKSVIEAIALSQQRVSRRDIAFELVGPMAAHWHRWALPEAESIPIALTVNELLLNAAKHALPPGAGVRCELGFEADRVTIRVANPGLLPPGFDLARIRGGVSGLGLVRALLPRRHARLSIAQEGQDVVASVTLVPPGVTLLEPL